MNQLHTAHIRYFISSTLFVFIPQVKRLARAVSALLLHIFFMHGIYIEKRLCYRVFHMSTGVEFCFLSGIKKL